MPGVRVNFGLKGSSITLGPRGSSINFGKRGGHQNLDLPGGFSFRSKLSGSRAQKPKPVEESVSVKMKLQLLPSGEIGTANNGAVVPISKATIKALKSQMNDTIITFLNTNCDELNEDLSEAINVHLGTPNPKLSITFAEQILEIDRPPKFQPRKPNFFQWIVPSFARKLKEFNLMKQKESEHAFQEWQNKLKEFDNKQEARRKLFLRRNEMIGDSEAFLEDHLQSLPWARETLISFTLSEDGSHLSLDVDLPELEDMPTEQTTVSQT